MTTPQDPRDQEQPEPFPSAPPPPPAQQYPPAQNPYAAPPLGAHELDPVAGDRPKDVETSFLLWVGAIVLGLVSVVLSILLVDDAALDEARRQLQADGNQFTEEQLDSVVRTAKIAGVVFLVVIYGLWLMFVLFMRQGKNWARIVLTVLSGLWVLLVVVGLSAGSVISVAMDLVQLALVAGAVYFMFRPVANQYFAPARHV